MAKILLIDVDVRDMGIVDVPFFVRANCVRPVGITDNNGLYF